MMIRVLLTDKHNLSREGFTDFLNRADGIKVVGAAGSSDAVIRNGNKMAPDVIVMHVITPELATLETIRSIQEQYPGSSLLLLSVELNPEFIFGALQLGVRGYLTLDSSRKDVIQAVYDVAAGKRCLSDKINTLLVEDYLTIGSIPPAKLSKRENEVLQMILEGQKIIDIARVLSLSPKTVETYRLRTMQKLGVNDTVGLIKYAMKHGLTS